MVEAVQRAAIEDKLTKLVNSFCPVLYEDDETFLKNMEQKNLAGDDIRRYQHWEWTQGVGLYGIWKLFNCTKQEKFLRILTEFFDRQLQIGFPALNVNTVTPFLTMSYVGEYLHSERYLAPCRETARWIVEHFPRTEEDGFQHITSDARNDQELWDDTLFMTVLFLANMGRIEGNAGYLEEAKRQILLHAKYLADPETGLWYHGWTFRGRHNFAKAFWGRGNCWVTIAIPEFLQMAPCDPATEKTLTELLLRQVQALAREQDPSGMWHTLLDDPDSYVEASATCGFGYGILRAAHTGRLDRRFEETAWRALAPILEQIDDEGILHQVSYGTPMGRESRDFYKNIPLKCMPYGQALAILFLIECLLDPKLVEPAPVGCHS
ncbi:MAG: glycoside hydrolase family 88 protein [Firmicutes bacterium]|nr:glycoside hydrolase family 88 protein [Bacillota bacterium]